MRFRPRHIILMLAAALTAGEATAEPKDADSRRPIVSEAPPRMSVEYALDDLRAREGFSFVYDSRAVEGKEIAPLYGAMFSERALKAGLAEVGLELHKIGRKSYAIAPITAAAFANAPAASAPVKPFSDVIYVTAAASAASGQSALASRQLFSIDEQQLTYVSGRTAGEILHDLPLETSDLTPATTVIYGALAGIDYLDLRGLGRARNTVLLNGRPATPTPGGNGVTLGVDLGRFPTPFLERIEIDSNAGAARYDSAAVAGAVNFVLRSNFDGYEAGADIGVSGKGDALETSAYFIAGKDVMGGAGNITAGVSLANGDELLGKQREALGIPYGLTADGNGGYDFLPGYGGDPITQTGIIPGVLINGAYTPLPGRQFLIPTSDSSATVYTGAVEQRYNQFETMQISPSMERVLGYISFSAALSDSLEIFAEAYGGVVATGNQLAPVPATYEGGHADLLTGEALSIPIDHSTAPAPLVQQLTDYYGETPDNIVLARRFVEAGPRQDDLNRYYTELLAGAKLGDQERGYLSLSYRFGRAHLSFTQKNRVSAERVQLTLDESACPQTPGCVLVNYFDPGGVTEEAVDFVTVPFVKSHLNLEEHVASVEAGRAIGNILPEDIFAKIGIDYKYTSLRSTELSPSDVTAIGLPRRNNFRGELETVDFTAALDLPVLREAPGVGELDVAVNYRFTASSVFDSISNIETAADWRPVGGVKLYVHHMDGRRPPNIAELYSKEATWAFRIPDPCAVDLSSASSTLAENCLSDHRLGVGDDFMNLGGVVNSGNHGNPALESEKAKSLSFGALVSPGEFIADFPGRLEMSATWRMYRVSNLIAAHYTGLRDCYDSVDFSDISCGDNSLTGEPIIARDPATKQLVSYDSILLNKDQSMLWRGLDLELRYAYEPFASGLLDRIWVNAFHTYTDKVEVSAPGRDPVRLDGMSVYPRHVTIVSAGAERGRFGLEAHATRRAKIKADAFDIPETNAPAVTYVGATLRFNPTDDLMLKFNVENIADREPPLVAHYPPTSNTLPSYYDVIGRRFTLSARVRF